MDQFTEDELGLNMLANPNRMSMDGDTSHNVSMNQPLFNDSMDDTNDTNDNNDYFQHADENPSYTSNNEPNFFDDNASNTSRVSIESTEEVLKKKNFLLTKLNTICKLRYLFTIREI